MPPVWPSPRPLIFPTGTPQAATIGPTAIVVLSPTPPVECLSTTLRPSAAAEVERAAAADHRVGERVRLRRRHAAEEDGHAERGQLVVGDLAARVAEDQLRDLARQGAPPRSASARSAPRAGSRRQDRRPRDAPPGRLAAEPRVHRRADVARTRPRGRRRSRSAPRRTRAGARARASGRSTASSGRSRDRT